MLIDAGANMAAKMLAQASAVYVATQENQVAVPEVRW
jgi:hypothetical protein